MNGSSNSEGSVHAADDQPEWALFTGMPEKPVEAGESDFGFIDSKGVTSTASCVNDLAEKIGKSRESVDLVWTPDSERMQVTEEVPALNKVILNRRKKFAERDISDGIRMGLVFGSMLIYTLYAVWSNGAKTIESFYTNQLTGLAALLFFIFGLLPFYEGWKLRRSLARLDVSSIQDEIPDARFDVWLRRQSIPVTWVLLACLLAVGLVQLYIDRGSGGISTSIQQAGQLKKEGIKLPNIDDAHAWWRVLTGGVLHGNPIHFLMNAVGILYLGRRTEALARWPHMLIVFVSAMWVGGIASAKLLPADPAVGTSGGLMGLLGFLIIYEGLHRRLVPRSVRRRLFAGVALMAVMGFLGMSFIDNAAHAGGLLAGMMYAWLVFPPSFTARRPRVMGKDKVVGAAAGLALLAICALACSKILGIS